MFDNVGLYREADTGGSAGGGSTQADPGVTTELQAKVVKLEAELASQRDIQAGLDRTVSRKDTMITALQGELNSVKTVSASDREALTSLQSEKEALAAQITDLSGKLGSYSETESQLGSTKTELNRLKIVISNHPELLQLAANDALPAAETDDDFIKKLDNLAESLVGFAANQQALAFGGSRPSSSTPPGGTKELTSEEYSKLAMQAFDAGDAEAGEKYLAAYRTSMLKIK